MVRIHTVLELWGLASAIVCASVVVLCAIALVSDYRQYRKWAWKD